MWINAEPLWATQIGLALFFLFKPVSTKQLWCINLNGYPNSIYYVDHTSSELTYGLMIYLLSEALPVSPLKGTDTSFKRNMCNTIIQLMASNLTDLF